MKRNEECYTQSGQPIKCPKCGCENLHDRTMNGQDGHIWEFERSCSQCKEKLGWWAFGHWVPDAYPYSQHPEHQMD